MSYEFRNAVNEIEGYFGDGENRFGASEKIVLAYLADCINDVNDRDRSYPGYGRIALATYLSRATIRRCIVNLERLGFIKVIPPSADGRSRNTYVLDLEFIKSKAPEKKTGGTGRSEFRDKLNAKLNGRKPAPRLTPEQARIKRLFDLYDTVEGANGIAFNTEEFAAWLDTPKGKEWLAEHEPTLALSTVGASTPTINIHGPDDELV